MSLEFSMAIDAWVEQAKGRQDAAVQAVALDTLNTVKKLTPVNTGFLRANWQVIRNNEQIPLPGRVENPEQKIAEIKAGDRVLIINPVIYARRVEYGFVGEDSLGRHYNQRGAAMVQRTLAALPEIARRAVARVSAGGNPMDTGVTP